MSFLDQKTKRTLLLTYNNKTVLQTCPNMTYFFNNHPNPNDSERTSVSACLSFGVVQRVPAGAVNGFGGAERGIIINDPL